MPTPKEIRELFSTKAAPDMATISLRIPADLLNDLDTAKTGFKLTRSNFVIQILKEYVPAALNALSPEELKKARERVERSQ